MSARFNSMMATALVMLVASAPSAFAEKLDPSKAKPIERGRYLARIAGCNDCHTPNYAQSGGTVPEKDWLIGDHLGWRGPWETTYPTNLRLYMHNLSEDQWVEAARAVRLRPPMPWLRCAT